MLIHTTTYQRLKKHDNSSVQLNNEASVDISHLIPYRINDGENWNNILMEYQLIPILNYGTLTSMKIATITVKSSNCIICFFAEEIKFKCLRILYNNKIYVTPLVNSFEYN